MIRISNLKLPLDYTEAQLRMLAARRLHIDTAQIQMVTLYRRSVDARGAVRFIATVDVTLDSPGTEAQVLRKLPPSAQAQTVIPWQMPTYPSCKTAHPPVVIGCGPAGLFAAWCLAQAGLRPILLERGKPVAERQAVVAAYHATGILDPDCNIQFGEGGAGTFSDGKLNTGTKDKRIRQVLQTFVDCGAPEEILWQAKPHIGTDRLAKCIPNLRQRIEAHSGTVLFDAKCTGFTAQNGKLTSIAYDKDGQAHSIRTDHAILAIGHSARDVFAWLAERELPMEQKAFSLGVRIEHLQSEIDRFCYGKAAGHPALGAASYQVAAHLPDGRGVYSFCMCPGGVVQAAASEPETVVTNGMSCFARNACNANSAILVGITPADFGGSDILAGVRLQRQIEQRAYRAAGANGKAPALLLGDFLRKQVSQTVGQVQPSYPLGVAWTPLEECLPEFICTSLRQGIPLLAHRLHGFLQEDAVLTAPETRSSSPVRILRHPETLESLGCKGLYPCGEGAGYAGGIMSAAVDGLRCAEAICHSLRST